MVYVVNRCFRTCADSNTFGLSVRMRTPRLQRVLIKYGQTNDKKAVLLETNF